MKPIQEQVWTYRGLSGCVTDEDDRDVSSPDAPDETLRAIATLPRMAMMLKNIHARATSPGRNGTTIFSAGELATMASVLREAGAL
jgi:hypothetical protein